MILLSLLPLKYWIGITGWVLWEADSKMEYSVQDTYWGVLWTTTYGRDG